MVKRSTRGQVYEAIRRMLREGRFRPGERIEPGLVAMQLHVSASPIRDALHTLSGQQLVEAHAHEGFSAPALTEAPLRELYFWQQFHVASAVDMARGRPLPQTLAKLEVMVSDAPLAEATAELFAAIVRQTSSTEMLRSIALANERLAWPRHLESQLFGSAKDEVFRLFDIWSKQDVPNLKHQLGIYFERRFRVITDLVDILYGGSPFEGA